LKLKQYKYMENIRKTTTTTTATATATTTTTGEIN
jgi:hypothetical protein